MKHMFTCHLMKGLRHPVFCVFNCETHVYLSFDDTFFSLMFITLVVDLGLNIKTDSNSSSIIIIVVIIISTIVVVVVFGFDPPGVPFVQKGSETLRQGMFIMMMVAM